MVYREGIKVRMILIGSGVIIPPIRFIALQHINKKSLASPCFPRHITLMIILHENIIKHILLPTHSTLSTVRVEFSYQKPT